MFDHAGVCIGELLVARHQPDMVLMDLMRMGTDGVTAAELAAAIRAPPAP